MSNDEQLAFTKASRCYLQCQQKLKEMYDSKKSHSLAYQDVLVQFDLLVQIMLLYCSMSDNVIRKQEIKFIDLITNEKDILDSFNVAFNKKYTWNTIKEEYYSMEEFKIFVDKTFIFFRDQINQLIGFIASIDSYTSKDYFSYFKDSLETIMLLFLHSNKEDIEKNKGYIDYIINRVFSQKYKELFMIFSSPLDSFNL